MGICNYCERNFRTRNLTPQDGNLMCIHCWKDVNNKPADAKHEAYFQCKCCKKYAHRGRRKHPFTWDMRWQLCSRCS